MGGVLDDKQIQDALTDRPDWEYRDGALARQVKAADFLGGIRLVDEVAVVAESLNHHPDIDVRYTNVTFRLVSHSEGGVTDKDLEMAGRIDEVIAKGA
ncbi:MAG TPA: 4a-hydroxytetrahydrobiopterin dehydratase [Nocardioidaceae bacterium]|nr:4a-hydroxytetrahydrobiopterin dehydratase [Nocardioidaceae bacterium]